MAAAKHIAEWSKVFTRYTVSALNPLAPTRAPRGTLIGASITLPLGRPITLHWGTTGMGLTLAPIIDEDGRALGAVQIEMSDEGEIELATDAVETTARE